LISFKPYARKLKILHRNHRQRIKSVGFFLLSSFILSGCAQKPWGDPFSEEESEGLRNRVEQLRLNQKECSGQWDANLEVSYHTALDDKKFAGYILVKEPSSFKFIASNPLGQPMLAITSNGKRFQLVDVLNNQYTHGSTFNFALRNDIPEEFISGQWGNWLAGKLDLPDKTESTVYQDKDPESFWYTESVNNRITESYLFDASSMLIKKSLLMSKKGKILAAFSYDGYVSNGACLQPTQITVDQLSFGASITLNLQDIQPVSTTEEKDFLLTVPSYYFIRYLP